MLRNKLQIIAFAAVLLLPVSLRAQDDLLDLLGEDEPTQDFASAGFKTTRIINGHSFEMNAHGVMDFKISHRFGALNGGAYELFGLDQASVRIGFDYGLTEHINIGVGRSGVGKYYDAFFKLKILRQQTGQKNIPISLLYVSDAAITTLRKNLFVDTSQFSVYPISNRMYYTHQIIIGRKFTDGFSLQFMPTLIHRNFVANSETKNDVFAAGFGGRVKLTNRVAMNVEYYYVLPNQLDPNAAYTNSLSIGFDIETGGHVFQLHFTNSTGMVEPAFITQTTEDWLDGGIHFGFNVSRVFTVYRPKN